MKTHKNSSHRINFSWHGERLTQGLCTPLHLCTTKKKWPYFWLSSYRFLTKSFFSTLSTHKLIHVLTSQQTAQVSQCYGRENEDTALLAWLRQEISDGKPVPTPVPLLCTESRRQVCVYRSSVSSGVGNSCLTTLCTSSKAVHQIW